MASIKHLRGLLHWMEERQRIYRQRQAGSSPPWTHDPIMQRYRFCNVYRNQDRVTRWLHDNWLMPERNHPNLWFACCLFRQINLPEAAAELGFPWEWNPRHFVSILERRAKKGLQNFNGAYMIRSLRNGAGIKPRSIAYDVLNPVWKWFAKRSCGFRTIEGTTLWLMQFPGWGGFMAYEAVTDMRWTHYLQNAPDINTWANPGPGAKRGLNRLQNRPVRQSLSVKQALKEMLDVYAYINSNRHAELLPTIEMRDIEHSLCEYDKYQRAKQALKLGERVGLDIYRSRLL